MARSYNKTNYGDLELFQNKYTEKELRDIVYNLSATVNARLKSLRESDETTQMFSDAADIYNRLKKKHPEYFTESGNLKRTLKTTITDIKGLETFIDEVSQIVLSKTAKQVEKDIEEHGMKVNKIKHLIHKYGKDKVSEVLGDKIVENVQKKPSDDEEVYDDTEIAETAETEVEEIKNDTPFIKKNKYDELLDLKDLYM